MIMGILNVTPDSFSDGGQFVDVDRALEHGLRMAAEGADIVDVGGESTRPGATAVPVEEELERVIPVIEALRRRSGVLISVDTMKAEVAAAAVRAGASVINDVNGLRDQAMVEVAAGCGAGVVAMHMQGLPGTMQQRPEYENVVRDVAEFFAGRLEALERAGIAPERVALDPGIGFGKTLEHNMALLRALPALGIAGRPLLVGVSRKSMIAGLLGDKAMAARHWPTVALTAWMRDAGAAVARVHDVRANVEAMRMMEAILGDSTE